MWLAAGRFPTGVRSIRGACAFGRGERSQGKWKKMPRKIRWDNSPVQCMAHGRGYLPQSDAKLIVGRCTPCTVFCVLMEDVSLAPKAPYPSRASESASVRLFLGGLWQTGPFVAAAFIGLRYQELACRTGESAKQK